MSAIIMLGAMLVFSASGAKKLVATGNNGESITWELYDLFGDSDTDSHYKLIFSGEGALVGYTNDGLATMYVFGEKAFQDCKSLRELVIYTDATIDDTAFKGCTNLKTLKGVKNSHAEAYAKANRIEFILPNTVSVYLDGVLAEEIDVVEGG